MSSDALVFFVFFFKKSLVNWLQSSSDIVHSFLMKLEQTFNNALAAQQSLVHQQPSLLCFTASQKGLS